MIYLVNCIGASLFKNTISGYALIVGGSNDAMIFELIID